MKHCVIVISTLFLGFLSLPQYTFAHVGPPFPIIVDKPVPGHIATVWADPDIGQATLYTVIEPDESDSDVTISGVEFWAQPVSGRLPTAVYEGARKVRRGNLRFLARPEFDRGEVWKVGIRVRLSNGSVYPFETEVEATPPGIGPWGLLFFLVPFVLFGGLWAMVFIRRSQAKAAMARKPLSDCV